MGGLMNSDAFGEKLLNSLVLVLQDLMHLPPKSVLRVHNFVFFHDEAILLGHQLPDGELAVFIRT